MVRICVREVSLTRTLVSFTHLTYIGMNVCSSAYENGCVVDGMCTTVADWVLLLLLHVVVSFNYWRQQHIIQELWKHKPHLLINEPV